MNLKTYLGFSPLKVYIHGPRFEEKKCPTLLYLSLSGEDSLTLDPYNQPISFLQGSGIRTLSVTLPGHNEGQDKYEAMKYWANNLSELQTFLKHMMGLLDHLFKKNWIEPHQFAVAGLSRGGYIATYLLSHPQVQYALGYAPLTDLSYLSEFQTADTKQLEVLSLENLMDKIYNKSLRYYMGNRDLKVGTSKACEFVINLAEHAYRHKVRSPKVELIISPSVGLLGHGTLPLTFQEGSQWIKKQIVQ
jgi:hypothetical protein